VTALERLAGGVLCVGFQGDAPAAAPLDELRDLAPGGIVLFSRNLSASPERNRELVDAIRKGLGSAVFAIDQEGGRVVRLRRGALALPSAMAVAASGELLAYRREDNGNALLIALNLGADPISIGSDTMAFPGEILLSTNLDRTGETVSGGLDLRGDEGLIIRLS